MNSLKIRKLPLRYIKCLYFKDLDWDLSILEIKFRSNTIHSAKSYAEFAFQLLNYFGKWINNSVAIKTKEKLKGLMILDQFYYQLSQETRLLIKDQNPRTVGEAAKPADGFSLNRGLKPNNKKPKEHFNKQAHKNSNYKRDDENKPYNYKKDTEKLSIESQKVMRKSGL